MKKILIWIIVLLLAVALFFILKPVFTGKAIDEENSELDKFAKSLSNANVTMYGTSWCSHCQNQKKLFGKSFKYINYVDCDLDSEICQAEKITGYPTWKINGTLYPGEKSFAALSQLSGVPLNF